MPRRRGADRKHWQIGARGSLVAMLAITIWWGSTGEAEPAAEPTAMTSPAPSGWFLQLSTLAPDHSVAEVTRWVAAACQYLAPRRPTLVLQDIVDPQGRLAIDYLDALAPYFPGGSVGCVGHLFVGTLQPKWPGEGSAYVSGIEDRAFRSNYVATSRSLAQQFSARYPYLSFDWYIPYEANLNDFFYAPVAADYASLLRHIEAALSHVRAGATFLWSPAFWYPWSRQHLNAPGMEGLSKRLTEFFSTVAASEHPLVIDLQDYVSASSCQPAWNRVTSRDALAWAHYLSSLPGAPKVKMNVEQYRIVDCATGGIAAAPPADLEARATTYVDGGVKLGPAFELRYAIDVIDAAN